MYEPGYKKLVLYQKAHQLVLDIYRVTKHYPRDEQFGLISQMRRASISVPANVIEGWARNSVKEKRNFCYIARGSLVELLYYLDLSKDLDLLSQLERDDIHKLAYETLKLLQGFLKTMQNS